MPELEILCPKCDWKPDAGSRWTCTCGHEWNVFETYGRCPRCTKIWKETKCHEPHEGGCSEWSPHIDWYRNLDDIMRKVIEEALKRETDIIEGV